MRARLSLRNGIKGIIFRFLIVMVVLILSFLGTFKILYNSIEVKMDNNSYIKYLVNDSLGLYDIEDIKSLSSTEFLLKYSFGIDHFNTGTAAVITTPVVKEDDEPIETNKVPLVYIFNTHQTEGYNINFLETFNINNTVFLGSHILGEYLNDLGIGVIVEENSVVDVLNTNGWKYGRSYKASRILMEEAYKNNPSLKFFIDLHRDSASYDRTVTEIDGKKYARVLFVVGLEHDNYQENLNLANYLNDEVKKFNGNLSRGVLQKKGSGVNGIYNQDFNKNTILIEFGGQYNYID